MEQFAELIKGKNIDQLSESEGLSFDDDRRKILESIKSIDVQACPGSGKTTLIAAKLMLLAKKRPLSGQGICVLSHTNVAKDEIIGRLKRSKIPEAQRLFSYPHFIGTIQEFVGKFLAFPCLKSHKIDIHQVDDDACVELIRSKLSDVAKSRLKNNHKWPNGLYDFNLKYEEILSCNVPRVEKESFSDSYKDLKNVREQLIKNGYLFYRDVFIFAKIALAKNDNLSSIMQKRFPVVFIDEMQDTQKLQDEVLQQTFPLDNASVIVQRFGDPDQAIFHGMGKDELNASFNKKKRNDMYCVINKSHRFDESIADKIKTLSFNQIKLSTCIPENKRVERLSACSQKDGFQHSVIIFDDDTINEVIRRFGDIVSNQFHDEYKKTKSFTVKALGAIGIETELSIGSYWNAYHKSKAKNALKFDSLIEIIKYCHQSPELDFSENYQLLIDGIIKGLSLSEKLDANNREFTSKTLQKFLEEKGKWMAFRKCIYKLLVDHEYTRQELWNGFVNNLKYRFELQSMNDTAKKYLSYSESVSNTEGNSDENVESMVSLPGNKIKHPDGFDIHLSTIHRVKGETHDATLIMETKFHDFDIKVMLPYIIKVLPNEDHPHDSLPEKPHHKRKFKPNKKFMRQLYVAASRPRHLLCIAIHASHITEDQITEDQKDSLINLGWKIVHLSQEAGHV